MVSSGRRRWLNSIAALMVICVPAVTDADAHGLITEYKECSIMMLRRVLTTPCPPSHYCHGGQQFCFPCSTCNGSDCRRVTYEPQCTNYFPFAYQMSTGMPQYTPACSVASLLRTSASGSYSKATAEVKVESCEPGCDNLGINGSERCFPGTSCQLACSNYSAIARSWTALCNCSYLGNTATCYWIQVPAVCTPAGIQLPTATAKLSVSERSPKGAAKPKSMLDITYASGYSGGTLSPDQIAGRTRTAVGQLDSLTKRTETGSSGGQELLTAAIPILGLLLILVAPLLLRRGHPQIMNVSNVRNDQIIIGSAPPDVITSDDVSQSPSDLLSDNSDAERRIIVDGPLSSPLSFESERGVRQLHGDGGSLAAADAPDDAQLLMAHAAPR